MKTVVLRVLAIIPLFVVVSASLFALVDLAPGDAAVQLAGENATPAEIQVVRERLGLDRPLPERYATWLGDAVQGDLGDSLNRNQSVSELIGSRVGPTVSLAAAALAIAVVIGGTLGVAAGARQGGIADRATSMMAAGGIALPSFVVGLFLVVIFSLQRSWLPATGYVSLGDDPVEWARHLVLPGAALAWLPAAEIARHVRSAVAEVLDRDYIVTAWAKGLRYPAIIRRHVLRNAGIPIVTVLGARVASLLGGTIVVETVFAIQGIGSLAVTSVLSRDVPVVLGVVTISTIVVLLINLMVDLSYTVLDPRARA